MKDSAAVLLGMGPTSLALVRALGRKSVPVYGIGLSKYEVSLSSKYCKSLGAADPRYNPDKMLDLLLKFGEAHHKDKKLVLYPTGDECVAFIGNNHNILSSYYRFSKLNPEIVELFLNKAQFHKACVRYGLPVPITFLPTSAGQLYEISKHLHYPCIAKPKYYHQWAMRHGLVKGVVCNNARELLAFGERFGDVSNFVIQQIMDGPETDIFVFAAYFDRDSRPHGVFIGNKIRQYPVGFGTTTTMKTAHKPELEEMSTNFLRKVGYQGLCDVEYKYDRNSNSFRIIEINPRLGRWYGIVDATGHDTMYYSFLDLTDRPIPDVFVKSRNVTWVFASRDFLSIAANKDWGLGSAFRSYTGPRTWCIWAKDDIKPFFAYFGEMAAKGIKHLRMSKNNE